MRRNTKFSKTRILTESRYRSEVLNYPERTEFDKILNEESWVYGENHCKIVDKENTNDYFWLYVEYNKLNPRRENIYNIETKKERPNERTHLEVELIKQNFFLYHYKSNILYIKNLDDKNILIEMLTQYNQGIKYSIESFYSLEEFMSKLKSVNKISFVDAEGLFGTLRTHLNLDAKAYPDIFQLTLQYEHNPILIDKIKSFLEYLIRENSNYKIKNLIIKGLDENDFETIFKKNTFTQKIGISPSKNSEDMWDYQDVKKLLLEEIQDA